MSAYLVFNVFEFGVSRNGHTTVALLIFLHRLGQRVVFRMLDPLNMQGFWGVLHLGYSIHGPQPQVVE
jgi:hypothetical protein